ncbi:MAG: hypothetical protein A2504_04465 [Bdellovibrionales bacterium RIFOXYD12_FULL_39_22]|nr:MAG: hypothetical protein A2385_07360 [Bdellovibrionales bacterium RIFOXYB1_FULL_39_21]OFZ42078.1 MAG: hypothetical protein A2485_09330 [Bdellovibrionales bacterium RIFOXYC12_FULL_39_17]OFZ50794.1 MAG: hypothetical protein A2404_06280 [Bdellovibrionales bacterium RIFOXYC1_FULL_39_130]OFZ73458.1 MAG: hypothetical protein A2451_10075 [Bdellovibrionales bacterium RIFOXYC2_FULL_39_8]OFZ78017.1 MAG: hypothetical protein A2560_01450 [Bdellovibrionales bacterium RIFOXYD1_FULL_39_84]OFZ93547.1 MAG:
MPATQDNANQTGERIQQDTILSVPFDNTSTSSSLEINDSLSLTSSMENVEINRAVVAGLQVKDETDEENSSALMSTTTKTPSLAIILGPGLYRSMAHLSVLKKLEQSGIRPNIICGMELGAIIAAMYARGVTTAKIEWQFYKFFKEVSKITPYSVDWFQILSETLLSDFKNANIEDSKITLVIPVTDRRDGEIIYLREGDLYNALLSNASPIKADSEKFGLKHSAAYLKHIFFRDEFARMGADIVVGIDVLGRNISLQRASDLFIGVWGKIVTVIQREKNSPDLYFLVEADNIPLDSTNKIPSLLDKSYQSAGPLSLAIKEKINEWKKTFAEEQSENINL